MEKKCVCRFPKKQEAKHARNNPSSSISGIIVSISYKIVLKELLDKLYLPSPIYTCQTYKLLSQDCKPFFIAKVEFKNGEKKITLFGKKASSIKETEQDGALQGIRHLQKKYEIVIEDVNHHNLVELKAEYKKQNDGGGDDDFKKKYEDAVIKFNELKVIVDHLSKML